MAAATVPKSGKTSECDASWKMVSSASRPVFAGFEMHSTCRCPSSPLSRRATISAFALHATYSTLLVGFATGHLRHRSAKTSCCVNSSAIVSLSERIVRDRPAPRTTPQLQRSCCSVSTKRAIGDLAGILGGPAMEAEPRAVAQVSKPRSRPVRATPPTATEHVEIQPRLLDDPEEQSDRITVILPISLLTQVDGRVAALRRKKKVSVSGYIEAALRELLSAGEHDVEALERHRIKARRTVSRLR